MFFKLLSHDLNNGIRKRLAYYAAALVISLTFCQGCYLVIQSLNRRGVAGLSGNLADYLVYLFQGMKVYYPGPDNPFIFPVMWVIIFILSAYLMLGYPFYDITRFGQQILVRGKSRYYWWISKCIWNVCGTVLYFGFFYLGAVLFCFVRGIPISFHVTPELLKNLLKTAAEIEMTAGECVLYLIVLPILVSLAFNMLEMLLGLLTKPVFSFGAVSLFMIISAYYKADWAIGNHSMVLRGSKVLGEDGVHTGTGLLLIGGIVIFSVVLGCIRFKRYDILTRE